jgi:3-phosphoglycerate kinase
MNTDAWDDLYRKYSILDIPCEGKNIVLRLDLDVPLSEYAPPIDDEDKEEENSKLNKSGVMSVRGDKTGRSKGKDTSRSKTTNKTLETGKSGKTKKSEMDDASVTGTQQIPVKKEVDILTTRTILDQTLIRKALPTIKHVIDHLAVRTFIAGNLGE